MCMLLHDYTLIANVAYVSNKATIPYTEIRKFSNILFRNLEGIPFLYESEDETVFEVFGHTFIRLNDEVMLVHATDEKFMEYVNGCYDKKIQEIIEKSRDEYFLKETPQGERIMKRIKEMNRNKK